MAGFGLGWLCSLLGAVSFLLPHVTFGVTKSWSKSLQGFGIKTLTIKGVIFFIKAILFLLMVEPTPAAAQAIMGTVLQSFTGACITACAVLSLISHESMHGQHRQIANRSWIVYMALLVGMGTVMYLIKERQQAGDFLVGSIILIIMFVQLVPSVRLIYGHCWSSGEIINEEASVATIKTVAVLIAIVTSLHSSWFSSSNLKPHVTKNSLKMHQAMCVAGTIAGVLQLFMSIIRAKEKLLAAIQKVCNPTDGACQFVSLVVVVECMECCAATIVSCFTFATQWMKSLFGPMDPVLPVVAEHVHEV